MPWVARAIVWVPLCLTLAACDGESADSTDLSIADLGVAATVDLAVASAPDFSLLPDLATASGVCIAAGGNCVSSHSWMYACDRFIDPTGQNQKFLCEPPASPTTYVLCCHLAPCTSAGAVCTPTSVSCASGNKRDVDAGCPQSFSLHCCAQ
jgi:hypothetical protein